MFGFPVNLQDSGVQKFTNDADNGFPKIQQREVFYSVKDGDWTDRTIWQTASGRVGLLPTQYDDVYLRHEAILNTSVSSCFNLFVSPNATLNTGATINKNIFIYGNLKSYGLIKGTSNFCGIVLYGIDNYVSRITEEIVGRISINYYREGDQPIMNLPFPTNIQGSGTKYLTSNTTLKSLSMYSAQFDAGQYDLTILESCAIQTSKFSKTNEGKLLFIGAFSFSNSGKINFSGNPNVEFRGGIVAGGGLSEFNPGINNWEFTTNNQTISSVWFEGNYITCPIVLKDGITLTIDPNVVLCVANTIDSTTSAAKVINKGNIIFGNTTSVPSFTTCQFDFTTFANTIQYKGNYTATIPSYFTTFHNLTISGTGTKSLGVDTTINGNLSISGIVTPISLDLSSYALNVIGMTFGNLQTNIIRSVSNSGKIARFADLSGSYGSLGINVGNTNDIEINGTSITNASNSQIYIVCRNLTFLTSITTSINFYGSTQSQIQNVIIGSGVTFNNNGALVSSTLNGVDGTSIFNNNSSGTYILNSNSTFMSTGVFNQNGSIVYNFNATRTIEFTSFVNLQIWSTSGLFTLSNNTNVSGFLTINNFAGNNILQLSNYDLIILGTIGIAGGSPINRNVANSGKILSFGSFAGNYGTCTIDVGSTNDIDVTGTSFSNPANGTMILSGRNVTFKASATLSLSNYVTINGNMIIDNSIIINTSTSGNFYINGTLIGNNSSSSFICRNVLQYNASTQPMATGILDTSTNANTWIYGSGNQDIKGGPTTLAKQVYRNLTLNGGGTKTLQGYVSVQNTYTLTSPATLNNNGFTLTNP